MAKSETKIEKESKTELKVSNGVKEESKLKHFVNTIGLPRLIISIFFILLLITAVIYKMPITDLISDVFGRWGMNVILVLAMVPGVQSGIGLNFGVSLGVVGGLLGSLISIELNLSKNPAFASNPTLAAVLSFLIAVVLGIIFATVLGYLYGLLLNKVKGSEMTVSTYVGFSIIAFMNIIWLILPFKNGDIIWPVGGEGIRNTVSLDNSFGGILNNFLSFTVGGIVIPTGLILFIALICILYLLFSQSKTGTAMKAAGSNENFAKAAGVNVNKMRVLGTTISTVIGAVGIIIYSQSYGFIQLYNAPLMMGFACVAAILIGGASVSKAKISNAIIGTLLFQGILAIALPVANRIIPEGNISEIIRVIISNGIILYALTKMNGGEGND